MQAVADDNDHLSPAGADLVATKLMNASLHILGLSPEGDPARTWSKGLSTENGALLRAYGFARTTSAPVTRPPDPCRGRVVLSTGMISPSARRRHVSTVSTGNSALAARSCGAAGTVGVVQQAP